MSMDYLNFMKNGRTCDIGFLQTLGKFNSSDESEKFSSVEMEGSSSVSTNYTTDSRRWKELKAISKNNTETSSESQTVDKGTDMKSLIEKQKSSYVRRLQREIKWLEKVEKLLLEAQKNKEGKRRKKKNSSPLKYQPLEINIRKSKMVKEKPKIVKNLIDGNDLEHCGCNCHQNEESENEDLHDRYFVSIPTPKKERLKNIPVKPVLGKTLRKIDGSKTTKMDSNPTEMSSHYCTPQPKVQIPGISWFVTLNESKPWLQSRGPGDGSHSNVITRAVQPDGNEGATSVQLSLQDAISYFKGNFILRSQARQQKIGIAARDRKHRAQLNYIYLTQLREQRFTNPEPETENLHRPQRRVFSHKEMREQTEKLYNKLPEVLEQKDKRKRVETEKTHRLMAQIFKRKIQEKTLQGKVSYYLTERIQHSLWDL